MPRQKCILPIAQEIEAFLARNLTKHKRAFFISAVSSLFLPRDFSPPNGPTLNIVSSTTARRSNLFLPDKKTFTSRMAGNERRSCRTAMWNGRKERKTRFLKGYETIFDICAVERRKF